MPFQYPDVLVFGDVTAEMAFWLRTSDLLTGVEIATDMDGYSAGDRHLYLERMGGHRDRFYDDAILVFEARGENYDDAFDIASAARGLAWAAPGNITRVVMVEDEYGPLRLPDTVTDGLFWRFAVRVRTKGIAPI